MSNLFDDTDLVPSDVASGLVILRKLQQMYRRFLIEDERNMICDFLSGVKITASTQFLDVNDEDERVLICDLIHYMNYSMASYGWPVAVMSRSRACCQLFAFSHCRCCPANHVPVHGDNACHCNEAAFRTFFESTDCELLFANYNVQITEPSFFVAIDYEKQAIVIVVRGTLSLDDMITDLNLTAEPLPLNPGHSDWLGHKGMIRAAEYIR
jgi:sn1-specific diacylglycerol lipase